MIESDSSRLRATSLYIGASACSIPWQQSVCCESCGLTVSVRFVDTSQLCLRHAAQSWVWAVWGRIANDGQAMLLQGGAHQAVLVPGILDLGAATLPGRVDLSVIHAVGWGSSVEPVAGWNAALALLYCYVRASFVTVAFAERSAPSRQEAA